MTVFTSTTAEHVPAPLTSAQEHRTSPSFIPQTLSTETAMYQDRHVLVSSQRLVVGIKTYDLAAIMSSRVRRLSTRKSPFVVLFVIAVITSGWLLSWWPLLGGIVAGIFLLGMIGLVVSIKPNYILRITTADGERDVLMSRDRLYIQRANDALVQALTQH